MRSYGMYDMSRGLTLALAAALAGLGLWGATQIGMQTTGRFWLSMAVVAGAGLLIALANHVGTWTKGLRLRLSPGTFVLAFVPVLIVAGWILSQRHRFITEVIFASGNVGNGWPTCSERRHTPTRLPKSSPTGTTSPTRYDAANGGSSGGRSRPRLLVITSEKE